MVGPVSNTACHDPSQPLPLCHCCSTVRVARGLADVVISSPRRGRAAQMNAGAAVAKGDVLVFCHADTQLPVELVSAGCAEWGGHTQRSRTQGGRSV